MATSYIRWRVEPNFDLARYEARVMDNQYNVIVQGRFRVRWFAVLWAKINARGELSKVQSKNRKRDKYLSRKRSGGRYEI